MLSVIVPTLNAEATLAQCLAGLAGADEIIVADGGSQDGTRAVAEAAGARLLVGPKGRGAQLRAGGEAAAGDWLLFVHADTMLAAGWQEAVHRHTAFRPTSFACFRLKLDDDAWQARAIEKAVALRVRLLGLPYGDQGLLVPRALYEQAGGYAELPLMEDVDLVRRLGSRRLSILGADAVTSAERWRKDGWFRRSARNLLCLALYGGGVPPERIARFYG